MYPYEAAVPTGSRRSLNWLPCPPDGPPVSPLRLPGPSPRSPHEDAHAIPGSVRGLMTVLAATRPAAPSPGRQHGRQEAAGARLRDPPDVKP